jgi:predicted transcriptional regulator
MNQRQLLTGPCVGRNISLPQALEAALQQQAIREDRPVSRVVRRALVEYLERQASDDHPSGKA